MFSVFLMFLRRVLNHFASKYVKPMHCVMGFFWNLEIFLVVPLREYFFSCASAHFN